MACAGSHLLKNGPYGWGALRFRILRLGWRLSFGARCSVLGLVVEKARGAPPAWTAPPGRRSRGYSRMTALMASTTPKP